jgi:lipid A 3-O-deacylase
LGTLKGALRSLRSVSTLICLKPPGRELDALKLRASLLRLLSLLALGLFTTLGGASFAADLSSRPPPDFTQTASILAGYEFRAGVLGSTWGPEKGDPYLNAEVIFPKVPHVADWADALIPRLQLGGMGNLAGATSYVYAGPIWRANYDRIFADFSLGGAIHDGDTGRITDSHRNKIGGCRIIYHVGTDIGYQITREWSAMLTFDHISNGSGTLSSCGSNEGVTVVGVRLGYTF